MNNIENPQAFPSTEGSFGTTQKVTQHLGMDLRDYFAGQYLAGKGGIVDSIQDLASFSYKVADAMLLERSKKDKG